MDNKTKILYAVITALVLTNCYLLKKLSKSEDDVERLMNIANDAIESEETEEAKTNTPFGRYIAEDDGFVDMEYDDINTGAMMGMIPKTKRFGVLGKKGIIIKSLYLRDDSNVEINDEYIGSLHKDSNGTYKIDVPEKHHFRFDNSSKDFPATIDKYIDSLIVDVDGQYLWIKGYEWNGFLISREDLRFPTKRFMFLEKDFKRLKKAK